MGERIVFPTDDAGTTRYLHRKKKCSVSRSWTEKSTPILSPSSDEEHAAEHTPSPHVPQPPQAVFPACICAAVLPIVHLMEDGEVREDGVAGTVVTGQNRQ